MGKKILLVLTITMMLVSSSYAIDETFYDEVDIEFSIENENLFISINSGVESRIEKIILRQGCFRKLVMDAILVKGSKTIFYIDAEQANSIKKHGIKSMRFQYENGSEVKVTGYDQIQKFTRSFP